MKLRTCLLVLFLCASLYADDGIFTADVIEEVTDSIVETKEEASIKQEPLVTIADLGQVRGSRMSSASGREILAFRGVPYAEPPVGDLRFRV